MPKKSEFIPYVDKKTGVKLHLRKDPSGVGVLIVNASRVAYLNETATFYVEAMLNRLTPGEIVKKALKRFKGVTKEKILKDYEEVAYKINSFVKGEACPITYLGFKQVDPFTVKTSAPFRADLAITYGCNNKCVHCYSSSPTVKRELELKKWQKILKKLFEIGVPNVLFTGGEPTLRDDLPEMIKYAENLGIVTGLVTNGRRLSDESFLDKLVKAGLDYVQVTLESNRPEIHDKITGVKGSWEETVKGVKNVLKSGLYLDVNTTLNKFNVGHVDEYVDFLHELGVQNVSANRLIYSGRGLEVRGWFEPSIEETAEALETFIEKTGEYGMSFRWYGVTRYCEYNPLEAGLGLRFCSACSITIAIEPDGVVIPCQSYFEPLGNILKDKWSKIWNNPTCKYLRDRKYASSYCLECPLFKACGAGCPLEAKARPIKPPEDFISEIKTAIS